MNANTKETDFAKLAAVTGHAACERVVFAIAMGSLEGELPRVRACFPRSVALHGSTATPLILRELANRFASSRLEISN
jgi:hypothetical protein